MRILVFQHLDVEHPGVLRDFWTEKDHEWVPIELDAGEAIPPLETFDLLTVMGGPMDVWQEDLFPWLAPEKAAIRQWIQELRRPFLGVCLGHQLMAEALGGTVTPMAKPEVGLADVHLTDTGVSDALLRGFATTVETVQWHSSEVSRLPEGAVTLASNAACKTQAMRWGEHAYGLQYHVEVTSTTVADWGAIPEYKASLEAALGIEGAERLAGDIATRLPAFRHAAKRLDENLASLVARAGVT